MAVTCYLLAGALCLADPSGADPPAQAGREAKLSERNRLWDEARAARRRGELAAATDAGLRMMAIERDLFGDDPNVAESLEWLADVDAQGGRDGDAIRRREDALAIRTGPRGKGPDHWSTAQARAALAHVRRLAALDPDNRRELDQTDREFQSGVAERKAGHLDQAIVLLKAVFDVREQRLGLDDLETLDALAWLAETHHARKELDPARQVAEVHLKQRSLVLGEAHPEIATSLLLLARINLDRGAPEDAAKSARQAVRIRLESLADRHADTLAAIQEVESLDQLIASRAWEERDFKAAAEHWDEIAACREYRLSRVSWEAGDARRMAELARALHALDPDRRDRVLDAFRAEQEVARLYQENKARAALPLERRALAAISELLGEDHVETAALHDSLGALLDEVGEPGAEEEYRRALAVRRQRLEPDHPRRRDSLDHVSRVAFARGDRELRSGDFAAAGAIYTEVAGLRAEQLGEGHWRTRETLVAKGHAETLRDLQRQGKLTPEDVKRLREADEANAKVLELYEKGDYAGALILARRVLDVRRHILGENRSVVGVALNNVGEMLRSLGDTPQAELALRRARDTIQTWYGPDHPELATALLNLGRVYEAQARRSQAVDCFRESARIREAAFGAADPKTTDAAERLMAALEALGSDAVRNERFDEATQAYQELVRLRTERQGEGHAATRDTRTDLARVKHIQALDAETRAALFRAYRDEWEVRRLAAMGQLDKARPLFHGAYEAVRRALGDDDPWTIRQSEAEGWVAFKAGDYAASSEAVRRSLGARIRVLGPDHPDTRKSRHDLAEQLEMLAEKRAEADDLDRAGKAIDESLAIRKQYFPEVAWPINEGEIVRRRADYLRALCREARCDLVEAARLYHRGEALFNAGRFDEAVAPSREALTIRERILGPDHIDLTYSLNKLGLVLTQLPDLPKAERLLVRAAEIRERVLGRDSLLTGQSLNNLAVAYDRMGNFRKADELYRRSGEVTKTIGRENSPEYFTSLMNQARVARALGDYARSEALVLECGRRMRDAGMTEGTELASRLYDAALHYIAVDDDARAKTYLLRAQGMMQIDPGVQSLHYAQVILELGGIARRASEYDPAGRLLEEALRTREVLVGKEHTLVAGALVGLGRLHVAVGEHGKALAEFARALEIHRAKLPPGHPVIAEAAEALGDLKRNLGSLEAAEPLLREAVAIRKEHGEGLPAYASALTALGSLHQARGEFARAESLFLQAAEIQRAARGERTAGYATAQATLAGLYRRMGDAARAGPLLHQALQLQERATGDHSPGYARRLSELGRFYLEVGDAARAEGFLTRAAELRKEIHGARHPLYAETLRDLGAMFKLRREYSNAERQYGLASQITSEDPGAMHQVHALGLRLLAALYDDMGESERAADLFRKAIAIDDNALGPANQVTIGLRDDLAELRSRDAVRFRLEDDLAGSAAAWREVIELKAAAHGPEEPGVLQSRLEVDRNSRLAAMTSAQRQELVAAGENERKSVKLIDAGHLAEALPLAEEALKVYRARLGDADVETSQVIAVVASIRSSLAAEGFEKAIFNWLTAPDQGKAGEALVGAIDAALREYDRAEALDREALAALSRALGDGHPLTVVVEEQLINLLGNCQNMLIFAGRADAGAAQAATAEAARAVLATVPHDAEQYPALASRVGYMEQVAHLPEPKTRRLAEAVSRGQVGLRLSSQDKLPEAAAALSDALAAIEEVFGPGPDSVSLLDGLIALERRLGNDEEAERLARRQLEILKGDPGEDSIHYAAALETLAELFFDRGETRRAAEERLKAVRIRRARKNKDADTIASLDLLARDQFDLGEYFSAEAVLLEAIRIHEPEAGKEDETDIALFYDLGRVHAGLGVYGEARDEYERAIRIHARIKNQTDLDYAEMYARLGLVLAELGDLAGAEARLNRARDLTEAALRDQPPAEQEMLAERLDDLARFHLDLSNVQAAEPLLARAEEITGVLGKEAGKTRARLLSDLGRLAALRGDGPTAVSYLEGANAAWDKIPGSPLRRAAARLQLADQYLRTGDIDRAATWLDRAADGIRESLGEDHPSFADCQVLQARVARARDDLHTAETLLTSARAIIRRTRGEEHPSHADCLRDLAIIHHLAGRPGPALEAIEGALRIEQANLRRVFSFSAEPAMRAAFASSGPTYRMLLALAVAHADVPAFRTAAMTWTLRLKAVVPETQARFLVAQRLVAGDANFVSDVSQWRRLRQEYADCLLHPVVGADPAGLRDEVEALEARLHARLAAAQPALFAELPDAHAVARRLPPGTVLVEYVRTAFEGFNATTRPAEKPDPRYLALVMRGEGEADPRLVPLGKASVVDELVGNLRNELERAGQDFVRSPVAFRKREQLDASERNFRRKSSRLAAVIYTRLGDWVDNAARIYVAPDGPLDYMPFEALWDDRPGRAAYLTDAGRRFVYLTSGRDLVRPVPDRAGRGTLLLAGPAYDAPAETRLAGAREIISRRLAASPPTAPPVDVREAGPPRPSAGRLMSSFGGRWEVLRGAGPAAERIARLLRDSRYEPIMPPLIGAEASEEALKSILLAEPAPRLLLLATDGYYVDATERGTDWAIGLGAGTTNAAASMLERLAREEHPLVRSGLVLAGANLVGAPRPDNSDDGWLTAEEVTLLDLRGTELVTLGACQTALGDARAGEGIAGLRRAFLDAGASTLLASLFKVPEDETYELLEGFYTEFLTGDTKVDALHRARRVLIERLRARDGTAHPFFWAGFIIIGNDN